MRVDLSKFDNSWYKPGRSFAVRTLWHFVNAFFLQNPLNPSSGLKVRLLRLFGAKVGKGVVLKPTINVKYPWNLEIGDYSWIGEHAWLDSLDKIKIGNNCCISQGVYFCTGNHDWTDPAFGLVVKPITVEDGAWVGARATVLPGVTIASHSIVAAGTVMSKDTEPYMIYSGNPAVAVKERVVRGDNHSQGCTGYTG
jgi:putative colanic acid biosynthesis acetyltransferase WcaF